jgi:hypothetical protein
MKEIMDFKNGNIFLDNVLISSSMYMLLCASMYELKL